MADIFRQRMTVDVDEDFVVFIIGMRVNQWWKLHKWLPVARAMPRMLQELYADPSLGLISHEQWFAPMPMMIQYWRSFEHLQNYAKSRDAEHLPAWNEFNKKVARSAEVGIWHETYRVSPGHFECVYHHMPQFGLAKVGKHIPAMGRLASAAGRMQSRAV